MSTNNELVAKLTVLDDDVLYYLLRGFYTSLVPSRSQFYGHEVVRSSECVSLETDDKEYLIVNWNGCFVYNEKYSYEKVEPVWLWRQLKIRTLV